MRVAEFGKAGWSTPKLWSFNPLRFETIPDGSRPREERCFVETCGSHFVRYVYRPLIGPDVLTWQREEKRITGNRIRFELPGSRPALYDAIMRMLPNTTLDDDIQEYRNLFPDWNLENLAEHICQYVESQGLWLQPQVFELFTAEAFGDLYIMSEAAGWKSSPFSTDIAPTDTAPTDMVECTLCHHQDMTHGNTIALCCGHVFHKHCFFPLWSADQRTNCPQCGREW